MVKQVDLGVHHWNYPIVVSYETVVDPRAALIKLEFMSDLAERSCAWTGRLKLTPVELKICRG
jgi:hypothetical protein